MLCQGGGDILGQRGKLGRLHHVDAAGGGQARGSASRLDPRGVGDDDFCAVIHSSFGRFPESQLVALDHNVPSSGNVAGVAQGADLGLGLVFKVQLHIINSHLTSPWSVVDVGHGATFGGDVAQVDLLGLDLDVSSACHVLDFVQGATFSLNVAKVQFNTWNHDLSAFRLMLEVGGGPDLGLYILQVRQRLIENLQLPLNGGRRLGWGSDNRHLLLLEDAEGLGRVAAWGARARSAAGVGGGRAGRDGRGTRGGGAATD